MKGFTAEYAENAETVFDLSSRAQRGTWDLLRALGVLGGELGCLRPRLCDLRDPLSDRFRLRA
jgi:hypothetical protein